MYKHNNIAYEQVFHSRAISREGRPLLGLSAAIVQANRAYTNMGKRNIAHDQKSAYVNNNVQNDGKMSSREGRPLLGLSEPASELYMYK